VAIHSPAHGSPESSVPMHRDLRVQEERYRDLLQLVDHHRGSLPTDAMPCFIPDERLVPGLPLHKSGSLFSTCSVF